MDAVGAEDGPPVAVWPGGHYEGGTGVVRLELADSAADQLEGGLHQRLEELQSWENASTPDVPGHQWSE